MKAEIQMLRRNEKEKKNSSSEELKNLEVENKNLMRKLNSEIEERKKEIEYWVAERATMREIID